VRVRVQGRVVCRKEAGVDRAAPGYERGPFALRLMAAPSRQAAALIAEGMRHVDLVA